MNLIEKIFNKKKKVCFEKNQIFLYVDNSNKLELRDEKDYFIFGRYNDDRSQFTNLATQEVFQLNTTYGNTLWLNLKGRTYSLTSGFGFIDFIDNKIVLKLKAYGIGTDFLIDAAAIDFKKTNSKNFKSLSSFYWFLKSGATDNISLKEVQTVSKDVNDYVYHKIAQELEKSQNFDI